MPLPFEDTGAAIAQNKFWNMDKEVSLERKGTYKGKS
jgi:hypothetical protein